MDGIKLSNGMNKIGQTIKNSAEMVKEEASYLKNTLSNVEIHNSQDILEIPIDLMRTKISYFEQKLEAIKTGKSKEEFDKLMSETVANVSQDTVVADWADGVIESAVASGKEMYNIALEHAEGQVEALRALKEGKINVGQFLKITAADSLNMQLSLVEGIYNWGESFVNTVQLAGAWIIGKGGLLFGGTSDDYKYLMNEAKADIEERETNSLFNFVYDDTNLGELIKENAIKQEEVRGIGNTVGELGMTIAVSYAMSNISAANGLKAYQATSEGAAALEKAGIKKITLDNAMKVAQTLSKTEQAAITAGESIGTVGTKIASTASKVSTATSTGTSFFQGFNRGAKEAFKNGATGEEGFGAAVATGSWDAFQMYIGSKINNLNPFKSEIKNAFLHVGLDTVDGAAEGAVSPIISMIYAKGYTDENGNYVEFNGTESFKEKYAHLFKETGGWANIGMNAAMGGIMSAASEAGGIAKYFRKEKDISNLDKKIKGAMTEANLEEFNKKVSRYNELMEIANTKEYIDYMDAGDKGYAQVLRKDFHDVELELRQLEEEINAYDLCALAMPTADFRLNMGVDSWNPQRLSEFLNNKFGNIFSKEYIDDVVNKIKIIPEEEWASLCKSRGLSSGVVGFVDSNGIQYLPSNADMHTAVHESLHKLSETQQKITYDAYGNKHKVTGIREYYSNGHTDMANESLTEYLSSKIYDGRYYESVYDSRRNGHSNKELFYRLDTILSNLYGDEETLLKAYLSNDTNFLRNIFDTYAYKGAWDQFVLNISNEDYLLKNELLNGVLDKIEINTGMKKQNIFDKIKNLFTKDKLNTSNFDYNMSNSNRNINDITALEIDIEEYNSKTFINGNKENPHSQEAIIRNIEVTEMPEYKQLSEEISRKGYTLEEYGSIKGVEVPKEIQDKADLLAKAKKEKSMKAEPAITEKMKSLQSNTRKLTGLAHRLKGEGSLSRKIISDYQLEGGLLEEITEKIGDSVRYTMICDSETITDDVKDTLTQLLEDGYSIRKGKFKNTFDNPIYKGLNVGLEAPDGTKIELQFHTAQSFSVKEETNHLFYEISRNNVVTTEEEKSLANKIMLKATSSIKVPDSLLELKEFNLER